jgi:hypothetical protein
MEIHLRVVPGINKALMLMSPNYQIEKLGEEIFGKIARFSIGMAAGN